MGVMDFLNYLGKDVDVVMDRPLGSKHPKHGFVYPVNYGFVPNTVSGDGEELDAYVLGEHKPLEKFTGVVKALIHRTNDNDDKLVVMRKDKNYTIQQIAALVEFQEIYFVSEIYYLDENKHIVSEKFYNGSPI